MFQRLMAFLGFGKVLRLALPLVVVTPFIAVTQLALGEEDIAAGKSIYKSACIACHAKDLSGATGFNLRDGVWVHGGSKDEILKTVSEGVPAKGMPAFGGVFSEEDRINLVAYILSEQVGFRDVSYKIFHIDETKHADLDALADLEPVKQGIAPKALADFSLPEVKQYALEFSGDFIAPMGESTWLHSTILPPQAQVRVFIDRESVPKAGNWDASWRLKPGKQHVTIQYTTASSPAWFGKDLIFVVTNDEKNRKLFPASTGGQRLLKAATYNIDVSGAPVVVRKKVIDLPARSISVGLPQKLNYAFNARSCAIVAAWKGAFLNVGPNIEGRGKDPSLPLAEWGFHAPEVIEAKNESCKFEKYTRYDQPEFSYSLGRINMKVKGQAVDASTLKLHYSVGNSRKAGFGFSKKDRVMQFSLPNGKNISVTSSAGKIEDNVLSINLKDHAEFDIQIAFKEMDK